MAQHDARCGDTADLRRLNKLFALQAQGLSAYDTGHVQPGDHADSDKNQQDILTKKGHQQDNEEHKREGVEDLQQTHHHRIHFAAEIPGKRTVQRAEDHRHQRRRHPNHQRNTPADRHAHQQIATGGVGPKVVARGHVRGIGHHAPVGIEIGE